MSLMLRSCLAAAALFGAAAAGPAGAAEMAFRAVEFGDPAQCRGACPQVIAADGEITSRTPRAFVDFVERNIGSGRLHSVILLNSQGGAVLASMQLGQAFRKIGAAAIVARPADAAARRGAALSARCYSACVYAFMGAVKRVVPPGSRVGIHRMFTYEANRSPEGASALMRTYATEPLVSNLGEYAQMMGVSNELVWTAETVNPDQIRLVSPQELKRWKLAVPKF